MRVIGNAFSAVTVWFFVVLSFSAEAHHSRARFNQNEQIVIDGTIVEFEWQMPHSYLTVRDDTGRSWLIETDGTPILARSGWTRNSFEPGDAVSARVHPSQTAGDLHVLLVSIQTPDGLVLASINQARRDHETASARASGLSGVWTATRSDTVGFYIDYLRHPLTEKGRQAQSGFDPGSADSAANCVPFPTPFFMTSNYWYLIEVDVADDEIVFQTEFYDAQRTVFVDGQHPENGERTVQGHSIGRWEDDKTLTIDTTLFSPHPSPVSDSGIPSGTQKHVIEHLTLSDDGSTVLYEVEVEDPEYLAEPVVAQVTWHYAPHLELVSAPCDSDAARRYLE